MQDRSVDPARGTLLSIPLFLPMIAIVLGLHWALWSENPVLAGLKETSLWTFVPAFIGGTILHEVIHGASWALAANLPRAT